MSEKIKLNEAPRTLVGKDGRTISLDVLSPSPEEHERRWKAFFEKSAKVRPIKK